ncbi:phosphonate monoester hydrolase [Roseibium denhamense]|uniref:Arylsulfatase A n=1 Tax=Roseibium denhamense TaxID=76305 RepID=A0ABY1N5K7_9HYPH|nr:sulfatase-like hydrolase/transferase [Roseibium denhamense]MTI04628.1 phosphonate monoester hydrolase [Roseibium denhamense]SMP00460.1 Arylsulfatase A [Roseibium denhamense]
MPRPNILLITADQWRGDCLGTAGHPVVKTPNLDAFAKTATLFDNHYAATAPCSPARASLYTGLYQMNHRVIANGSPLDDRFDNIARAGRRAGYLPTLFGYTDTSPDPRRHHPDDPALTTYEGILPGFAVEQSLPEDDKPWLAWLIERGHDPSTAATIHHVEPEDGQLISLAPARYSQHETQTAFLTNRFLAWLDQQESSAPWMAHISFLRPHPPLAVPEPYNSMYAPEDGPGFAGGSADQEATLHPLIAALHKTQKLSKHIPGTDGLARDLQQKDFRRIRALYYGMISEVDAQLGRIFEAVSGLENTLIIFTSDHGEMMGDHGMLGKGGFYSQSYHIPLMIQAPDMAGGNRISSYTSATDIFPTLLDVLGLEANHSPDGASLLPFMRGGALPDWRDAAIFEFDYRVLLDSHPECFPESSQASAQSLMCRLTKNGSYVHFGGLPNLLLADDRSSGLPENALESDRLGRLDNLEALLSFRMRHSDETLARAMVWDFYDGEPNVTQ